MGALEKAVGRAQPGTLDDLATVIFSSGSTGEPKGIMLTHYNLVSNAEGLGQLLDFGPQDRFLGILPFFHSFGFTATLAGPALLGIGVAFHPNPLDAKPIGELVRRYSRDLSHGDADLPAILSAQLRPRRFWESAFCHGQCRETARLARQRV